MDSGGCHGPSQRSEQTVGDMIDRVLPEEERELLRLYFGIGRRRHSMDELIALFESEHKVNSSSTVSHGEVALFRRDTCYLQVSTQIDHYFLHFACWLCSSSTSFSFIPCPTSFSRLIFVQPVSLSIEELINHTKGYSLSVITSSYLCLLGNYCYLCAKETS